MRRYPNIIITGTPGTGKTSHSQALVVALPSLTHLAINDVVKARGCHEGWDESYKSWIVDEDKLLDAIEDEVQSGGRIIDWHACEVFPRRWVDLVVVLRTDGTVLFDRLVGRGYDDRKVQENLDSEIMQVLLEEARESYDEEIVVELRSDTVEEMEGNVERIVEWVEAWLETRRKQEGGDEAAAGREEDEKKG